MEEHHKINWLVKHCKKSKEVLLIKHLLEAKREDKIYEIIYEKDATSSGLQIISLLMHNEELANKTNIRGNKAYDIYKEILNIFLYKREKLKKIVKQFISEVCNITYDAFMLSKNNKAFNNLLRSILTCETDVKVEKRYIEIEHRLSKAPWYTKLELYQLPSTNLNTISTDSLINKSKSAMLDKLKKLAFYFRRIQLLDKIPEEVLKRTLFKQAVMTLPYSAGKPSRIDQFKSIIQDAFITRGVNVFPLSSDDLFKIAEVLNRIFEQVARENLNIVIKFLDICKKFTQKDTDIKTITMPYLTWNLQILKQLTSQHKVKTGNSKINFKVIHNYGLDKNQVNITFPSIFVQGIDAHIIHVLLHNVAIINEELRATNLPEILLSCNHDCFGINMFYAPILVPLVMSSYNTINTYKFSELLGINTLQEERIQCDNPNCIKY